MFPTTLVEIGLVVERKKFMLDGWRTLCHGISSHGLWPGELKIQLKRLNETKSHLNAKHN